MNLKNNYLIRTVHILFGLFMIFAAVAGFMSASAITSGEPIEGVTEDNIRHVTAYWETGILQLAKIMELIIGLMLIFNFLPALATVFLVPLSIGFVFYHGVSNPQMILLPIVILLINIYLAHIYWDKYKPILQKDKKGKKK